MHGFQDDAREMSRKATVLSFFFVKAGEMDEWSLQADTGLQGNILDGNKREAFTNMLPEQATHARVIVAVCRI